MSTHRQENLIAAIAGLINTSPRSPSKDELRTLVRKSGLVDPPFPGDEPDERWAIKIEGAPMRVLDLAELKCAYGVPVAERDPVKLFTVEDLHAWTETVTPHTISTREPFPPVEYAYGVRILDAPEQVAQATDILIRSFMAVIKGFCRGAGGNPVYWRIKPDVASWIGEEVVEYRHDGPDICDLTDKRCVKDRSHRYLKVRARISVDNLASGTRATFSMSNPVPVGWKLVEHVVEDNAIICVKL